METRLLWTWVSFSSALITSVRNGCLPLPPPRQRILLPLSACPSYAGARGKRARLMRIPRVSASFLTPANPLSSMSTGFLAGPRPDVFERPSTGHTAISCTVWILMPPIDGYGKAGISEFSSGTIMPTVGATGGRGRGVVGVSGALKGVYIPGPHALPLCTRLICPPFLVCSVFQRRFHRTQRAKYGPRTAGAECAIGRSVLRGVASCTTPPPALPPPFPKPSRTCWRTCLGGLRLPTGLWGIVWVHRWSCMPPPCLASGKRERKKKSGRRLL